MTLEASVPVPHAALKSFERISLAPGESETVEFEVTPELMEMVNESGERVLEKGAFAVTVGGASPGGAGGRPRSARSGSRRVSGRVAQPCFER